MGDDGPCRVAEAVVVALEVRPGTDRTGSWPSRPGRNAPDELEEVAGEDQLGPGVDLFMLAHQWASLVPDACELQGSGPGSNPSKSAVTVTSGAVSKTLMKVTSMPAFQ